MLTRYVDVFMIFVLSMFFLNAVICSFVFTIPFSFRFGILHLLLVRYQNKNILIRSEPWESRFP